MSGADNGTHYEKGEECDPVEGKPILQAIYDMSSEIKHGIQEYGNICGYVRTEAKQVIAGKGC
jgi:hypothetical protein